MNSIKALEMINTNRIDELKAILEDEVYNDEISKGNPGAKKRYAAMKKYFTYTANEEGRKEYSTKPCKLQTGEEEYTSFCDGFTIVLTKEPTGNIELFDDYGNYIHVHQYFKSVYFDDGKLNVKKIISQAKSKGYKLNKKEVVQGDSFSFVMHYKNDYYKIGLLDMTTQIIDDGDDMDASYNENMGRLLYLRNKLGKIAILPLARGTNLDGKTIIEV
jgi:hypothetical protein